MAVAKTIGIVGGGQLGRMLTLAALPLGFRTVVVNPVPGSPAAQVGASEIIGSLYDPQILEQLAQKADVITVEIEHLDAGALKRIAALDTPVHPAPETVQLIQDKLRQKEFLQRHGVRVAPFAPINSYEDAVAAWSSFGRRMIIKTRHGAYDGRGNMVTRTKTAIRQALQTFAGKQLYAEQLVPFQKELAIMVARSVGGDVRLYPLTGTTHMRNICLETCTPAQVPPAITRKAEAMTRHVAQHLHGAGMFGIEMFLTKEGNLLVNEIAPRVHNSGHYTLDACRTSQFEQHIRAIAGLPLGPTHLIAPAAVMVNILGERDGSAQVQGLDEALSIPHTSVHIYGKSPTKIDRKMGHITATGNSVSQARMRARKARKKLQI